MDLKLRIKDLEHNLAQPVNNRPFGGNGKKNTKHIEIVSDEDYKDTELKMITKTTKKLGNRLQQGDEHLTTDPEK